MMEWDVNALCVSVEQARQQLGVGRTMIYELIKTGRLSAVKLGRRTLIKTSSIREVIGEDATTNNAETT